MIGRFITWFFRLLNRPKHTRRYEILLPLKYNDGTEIERDKIDKTTEELADRFGGVALELVRITGLWKHSGEFYQDDLFRFRVDTPDPGAKAYFWAQKEVWKERFRQIDLWITVHDIEVL
jgi:hypothetical protein